MWNNQIPCCLLVIAHLCSLNHLTHSQGTGWIPPTPQIHALTADFISDLLDLAWYDGASAFSGEIVATWQIQILRKQPMEEVALEIYRSTLTGLSKLLHWTWVSDLPLNCTTHHVRIRCQFHGKAFDGTKWSQWSSVKSISGLDTGAFTGIYPINRVVEVGSNVTFCCVWKEGQRLTTLNSSLCYISPRCWAAPLSKWSMSIHVQNVSFNLPTRNNAWCIIQNREPSVTTFARTILFVGYRPDTPQNFTCKRENSVNIACKWERGKSTKLYGLRKTSYVLFERISGKLVTCPGNELDRRHYQCSFPIQMGQATYNFTVHAFNRLGQAEASLLININVIPPTPQIHRLTPNFASDMLDLEWYDGASTFSHGIYATWQIQILRKDPMEKVALETYNSKLSAQKKLLHWTWTSELPFNCTAHFVRIRCQFYGNEFDGWKWSSWSQLGRISGLDTGSHAGIYPINRVVKMGSNVTLCCVWKNGQRLITLNFSPCLPPWCWTAPLSNWSRAIHVQNVSISLPSGNHAWCRTQETPPAAPSMLRTLMFIGYPPDVPQNLTCKERNSELITCQWGQGRSTKLFGDLRTNYFLFEEISGKNITCKGENSNAKHYQCNFPILHCQLMYDFTVYAFNHLGQANASFSMYIKCRDMVCKRLSYTKKDLLNSGTGDSFDSYGSCPIQ